MEAAGISLEDAVWQRRVAEQLQTAVVETKLRRVGHIGIEPIGTVASCGGIDHRSELFWELHTNCRCRCTNQPATETRQTTTNSGHSARRTKHTTSDH